MNAIRSRFFGVIVLVCGASFVKVSSMEGQSPALMRNSESLVANALFIENSDFRLFFCDVTTLKDRIAKGVCIVNKAGSNGKIVEVSVISPITIGEVLAKAGMKGWNGATPQVRLIQRNHIHQSAKIDGVELTQRDVKEFSNTIVAQGDIIIASYRR